MDPRKVAVGIVGEVSDKLDADIGQRRVGRPGGHEEKGGARRDGVTLSGGGADRRRDSRERGAEMFDEGLVGEKGMERFSGNEHRGCGGSAASIGSHFFGSGRSG